MLLRILFFLLLTKFAVANNHYIVADGYGHFACASTTCNFFKQAPICWGSFISPFLPPVNVTQLSAGGNFFCFIDTENILSCYNDTSLQWTLTGASTYSKVSSGYNFVCAISNDTGGINCWGDDSYGQITQVPQGSYLDVSCGVSHACAIQSANNHVICWGDNSQGQAEPYLSAVLDLAVGRDFSCVIDDGTNQTRCWGTPFVGDPTVGGIGKKISAKGGSLCVMDSNGMIRTFGPTGSTWTSPTSGIWKDFSCGDFHALAVDDIGQVHCWGNTSAPECRGPTLGGPCSDLNCACKWGVCQEAIDNHSESGCRCYPGAGLNTCSLDTINACVNNPCLAVGAICTDYPPPAPDSPLGRKCTCGAGFYGDGDTCTGCGVIPYNSTTTMNPNPSCTNGSYPYSQCTLQCQAGYTFSNGGTSRTIACAPDNLWSNLGPCYANCPAFPVPPHATQPLLCNYHVSTSCTFVCDTNYTRFGPGSAQCGLNSTWGPIGECIEDCLPFPFPENSENVTCDPDTRVPYKGRCNYTCAEGYEAQDETSVVCGLNSTWDAIPSCDPVDCGLSALTSLVPFSAIVTLNSTTYLSDVALECAPGYLADVPATAPDGFFHVTCQSDKTWSAPGFSCLPKDCGTLEAEDLLASRGAHLVLPNCSTLFPSVCELECNMGFGWDQTSAQTIVCESDGHWAFGVNGTCQADCGSLPRDDFLTVNHAHLTTNCSNTISPTSCDVSCDPGYEWNTSVSSQNITCQSDGNWTFEVTATCQAIDCGANSRDELISSIRANLTTPCSSTSFPTSCPLLCEMGHSWSQNISQSISCDSDGRWTLAVNMTCQPYDCGNSSLWNQLPLHAVVSSNCSTFFPSTCSLSCETGYYWNGSVSHSSAWCIESGSWVISSGNCIAIDCTDSARQSLLPQYATLNSSSCPTSFPSSCPFSCDLGYVWTGAPAPSVTCGSDGNWTISPGECAAIDCGASARSSLLPSGASLKSSTCPTTYPSACEFECAADYVWNGTQTAAMTCDFNGNWNLPDGNCTATCAAKPCKNGGACTTINQTAFVCSCSPCTSGSYCEAFLGIPSVRFATSAPSQMLASQPFSITVVADLPPCVSSYPMLNYSYSWSHSLGNPPLSQAQLSSRTLYFPSATLSYGNHSFDLIVRATNPPIYDQTVFTHTVSLQVLPSPLVCQISGGTNRSVSIFSPLSLDGASLSKDPDNLGPSPLIFRWTCAMVPGGTPCVQFNALVANGTVDDRSGVLEIPANWTVAGEYEFMLMITAKLSGQSANASVIIHVQEDPIPQVSIEIANGNQYVNPQDALRLSARISDNRNLTYQWTEVLKNLNLSDPKNLASPVGSRTLVIARVDSLMLAGELYKFVITVRVNGTTLSSSASIVIAVNSPPTGGVCSLSPTIGISLLDKFFVNCTGWRAVAPPTLPSTSNITLYTPVFDPLDLTFSFAYNSTQSPTLTQLTSPNFLSTASMFLAAGNWSIYGLILDNNNGALSMPLIGHANVSPVPNGNGCLVKNYTDGLLNQVQQLEDTDSILQLIQLFLQILRETQQNEDCLASNQTQLELQSALWVEFLQALNTTTAASSNGIFTQSRVDQIAQTLIVLSDSLLNETVFNHTGLPQAQIIDLTVSILRAIINALSISTSATNSLISVFSSLLYSVPCSQTETVIDLLKLFTTVSSKNQLPDEDFMNFVAPRINNTGARVYSDQNITIYVDDLRYSLTQEMLTKASQGGVLNQAFVDVTVTRYDSALRRCRSTPGQVPQGDIISIDIYNGGKKVNVSDLGPGFEFFLPVDPNSELLSPSQECEPAPKPVCSWWDETNQSWSNRNCTTIGLVKLPNASAIQCSCTHLTDFTVLMEIAEHGSCALPPALSYQVFACIYLAVFILSFIQLLRVIVALRKKKKHHTNQNRSEKGSASLCGPRFHPLLGQHSLICLVCILRSLKSAFLGAVFSYSLTGLALVTAAPYAVMFWVYTTLVFEWANIYHYAMKKTLDFGTKKLRPFFFVCNVLVMIIFFILFISIAINFRPQTFELFSSVVMASVYCLTGLAFFLYGSLLAKQLASAPSDRPNKKRSTATKFWTHVTKCTLAARIQLAAVIVSICFILESLIWIVSVYHLKQELDSLFSSLDILALLCILSIFFRSVTRLTHEASRGPGHHDSNPVSSPAAASGIVSKLSIEMMAMSSLNNRPYSSSSVSQFRGGGSPVLPYDHRRGLAPSDSVSSPRFPRSDSATSSPRSSIAIPSHRLQHERGGLGRKSAYTHRGGATPSIPASREVSTIQEPSQQREQVEGLDEKVDPGELIFKDNEIEVSEKGSPLEREGGGSPKVRVGLLLTPTSSPDDGKELATPTSDITPPRVYIPPTTQEEKELSTPTSQQSHAGLEAVREHDSPESVEDGIQET